MSVSTHLYSLVDCLMIENHLIDTQLSAPSPQTPPPPSRWSQTPEIHPPLPPRQPRTRRTLRSTYRHLSSRLSSCRRRTLHACAALRTSCHSCNVTCHPEAGHVIVAKITRGGRTCTVSESCLGSWLW